VNDFPFFKLGETCVWSADAVRSKLELLDTAIDTPNDNHHDEIVAFIHARDEEIQSVPDGVNMAIGIYNGLNEGAAANISEKTLDDPPPESVQAWSFELLGRLGFLWEAQDDEIQGEFMVRGVKASLATLSAEITAVEQLYVPGTIKLTEPIENTVMTFDGTLFHLKIGDIVATLVEEPPEPEVPVTPEGSEHASVAMSTVSESTSTIDSEAADPPPFIMPFGVKAAINSIILFGAEGDTTHTTMKDLKLAVGPDSAPEGEDEKLGGIRIALIVESIDNDMITVREPALSGLIFLDDLAKNVAVAPGYTALDWKRLFNVDERKKRRHKRKNKQNKQKHKKSDSAKPISLPFAHIAPLKIKILVSGDFVGFKESTLHIGVFEGTELTTSDDLIHFYSSRVVSKVPHMITNANIMGADVQEGLVTHFGGAAGAATLGTLGAAAGSVGGVLSLAAFDGVRNTIKAGKISRGAEEDDKMEAGDIFRGLSAAATNATRGGAARRGKTEEQKGDPLDWAVGATHDVASYTNENKSRLGGAGAGTAGFAYGMLLGGPVGAVAGALIASVAASKTIDAVDNKMKGKSPKIEASVEPPNQDSEEKSVEYTVDQLEAKKRDDEETENSFEASLSENPIPLRGILLKRRDFVKWDWRAHYFVLDGNVIQYFHFEDKPLQNSEKEKEDGTTETADGEGMLYIDDAKGPLKSLKMSNLSVSSNEAMSKPENNLFVFTINSPQQRDPLWVLAAASEETRENWISRIGSVCQVSSDDLD
jgi:hypothetical protein